MIEKNKKAKKNKMYIINIIAFVYILSLSIGYAFFQDSLTINGVASTMDYYSGTSLPVTPIIRDTENNRYYTYDVSKNYVDFKSETWEGDTYKLNYDKKVGVIIGKKTVNYVVSFTNPTALKYTNGTVEGVEIKENATNAIKEATASISKTEIEPGESVDVTFTITHNIYIASGVQEAVATISYMYQNKPRYFYFDVYYD